MTIIGIAIELTGKSRDFERMLDRSLRRLKRFEDQTRKIGRAMTIGVTLPLAIAGGAAIKTAAVFDKEMTKIETLVGVAAEQVDEWREALLKLAPEVGRGPTELSRALFVVTSAGERTATALDIVERAAKASAIGLGDTAEIARTVTAAMRAYAKSGLTAAAATDTLVAIIREGNLDAASLSASFGRVIGLTAEMGVSFQQAGAFIATFTRLGVNAEESVTALRGLMNSLLGPSDAVKAALKGAGTSLDQLRNSITQRGLATSLVELIRAFDGNADKLKVVIPNIRALAGVLGTAGAQGEDFLEIARKIEEANELMAKSFARVTPTAAFKFDQLKASLQVAGITLGNVFLPAFVKLINLLNRILAPFAAFVNWVQKLPSGVKSVVIALTAFLAVLGPTFLVASKIAALIGFLAGAGGFALLATPVGWITAAIAGLVGVTVLLVRHWETLKRFAGEVWRAIALVVLEAFDTILEVFNLTIGRFSGRLHDLVEAARQEIGEITFFWIQAGHAARQMGEEAEKGAGAAEDALSKAKDEAEGLLDGLGGLGGGGGAEGVAKVVKKFQTELALLEERLRIFGAGHVDFAAEKLQLLETAIVALQKKGFKPTLPVLLELIGLWQRYAKHIADSADETERLQEQQDKAARVIEETLTPLERYNRVIDTLDELQREHLITQEQWSRGVLAAARALEDSSRQVDRFEEAWKRAVSNIQDATANLIENLTTGLATLKSFIEEVIRALNRIAANVAAQAIIGAIARSLGSGLPPPPDIPPFDPSTIPPPLQFSRASGPVVHQTVQFNFQSTDAAGMEELMRRQKPIIAQVVAESARESLAFREALRR